MDGVCGFGFWVRLLGGGWAVSWIRVEPSSRMGGTRILTAWSRDACVCVWEMGNLHCDCAIF